MSTSLVLRAFFLIPVVLTCFALSPAPKAFAVSLVAGWRLYDQREIAELKEQVKAQATAIQKVSDRVELSIPSSRVADNH